MRSATHSLWVADLTYVSTWAGFAYVAFVTDAYARRILGWRVASTMATSMVLDAIEQAIWTRQQEGVLDLKDVGRCVRIKLMRSLLRRIPPASPHANPRADKDERTLREN